jgi:N-methylhydantoinase A/oxoprolinase/acetone carboxylase beta subunit
VYAIWAEDEAPRNLAKGSNPHASYHANGRLHSKTYDQAVIVKKLQLPDRRFRGNQPMEATNADRAASPTLPPLTGHFVDVFELRLELITGKMNQSITVAVVEPGLDPVRVTGKDRVLAEKVFQDEAPWIVVSFVETAAAF